VKGILESPEKKRKIVNLNYNIASRHYSFRDLQEYLHSLIAAFFGAE
jgi:hypothetical protein